MKKDFKNISVIIDTNIWVSFLIGKQMAKLDYYLFNKRIKIIMCEEQMEELTNVLNKPKLSKYLLQDKKDDFFALLTKAMFWVDHFPYVKMCRDPKDDFLLSLAIAADADYLISGDVDLLSLKQINNTKITNFAEFEKLMLTII